MDKVTDDEHILLVETTSNDLENLVEALPNFNDSIMSTNDTEFRKIWKIRESIALAAER